jgi:hypothetical protein
VRTGQRDVPRGQHYLHEHDLRGAGAGAVLHRWEWVCPVHRDDGGGLHGQEWELWRGWHGVHDRRVPAADGGVLCA